MLITDEVDAKTMREILRDLRGELRQLAIGERLDRTAIESIRGFITFTMNGEQYKKTLYLHSWLEESQCKKMLDQLERLRGLSGSYFKYFEHYWKCYDEGNTLAKYDMISYGESYVITMLETLRIEEKLFNLTTNNSIVK